MKALFVTTDSVDCFNHVRAWESVFGKALHFSFNLHEMRNDWRAVEMAEYGVDVVFYIGAVQGRGIPRSDTFKVLQTYAPVINLCSDAVDTPWHRPLEIYKTRQCFNAQVSLDGGREYVDISTLTPIDPNPFHPAKKTIRFGFSGGRGRYSKRSEVISALEWFSNITIRERAQSYQDHVDFMAKCQMLLNTCWTGTGRHAHIKGRVIEAGYAGCALLEHEDSPIAEWFPKGAWIPWKDPKQLVEIVNDISDKEIKASAKLLQDTVKSKYTAEKIYWSMLNYVDITEQGATPECPTISRSVYQA